MTTKYFPVPQRKKRTKPSVDDVPFEFPFRNSYEYYYAVDDALPDSVPNQFIANSQPRPLQAVPNMISNPSMSPLIRMQEERERSEASMRSLVGQQQTIQDELEVFKGSTIESLTSFISAYSSKIAPETKLQMFGRTKSIPVSAITSGLKGKEKTEKREILSSLVARSDLADKYKQFHERHLESKKQKQAVKGLVELKHRAESSSMAEARSRTTRHTPQRIEPSIVNSNEPMRDYIVRRPFENIDRDYEKFSPLGDLLTDE